MQLARWLGPLVLSAALAACASVTGSAPTSSPDVAVPRDPMGVVIHRLSNGLTVMISPNHEEPRVLAHITVRAGSAKDPAEATGMAHYLEHMLFKGTTRLGTLDPAAEKVHLDRITELYDELFVTTDAARREALQHEIDAQGVAATQYQIPNELDQLYDEMGMSGLNAFTSNDQTSYVVNLPANRLEHWATVEAERFRDPVFRLFQTELEAVYEEMNQSLDSPGSALFQALYRALYPEHPYGTQPTIGTVEHLKNPAISKMYAYFRTWYVPGNMCIAIAGDVDPADTIELLERHFGSWEPRKFPDDPVHPLEPPAGRVFVEVVHKGDEQVAIAFPTVAAGHTDQDALVLCDMMLDNGQTGLINRNLDQAQATRSAGSSPTFMADAGYQLLYALPKADQTLEECEALLLEQVAMLRDGAFTEADLAAVLTDFEVTRKRALEDLESRVSSMTDSFVQRTPWERTVRSLERLHGVTKADVVAAARRYFADDFVVAYRRNGEPVLPEVNKPGFTPVEIEGDRHTPFYESVIAIPARPIEPVFAVAGRDYEVKDYPWGRIYHARNPLNDLFDLQVLVEVGTDHDRRLELALDLVDLGGAGDLDPLALRRRLYSIGSSIGGASGEQQSELTASGLDAHFRETVALLRDHFKAPTGVSQADLDKLAARVIGGREVSKRSPRGLSAALSEFAQRGPRSAYLAGPTDAELLALQAGDLLSASRELLDYRRIVVYVGTLSIDEVAAVVGEPQGAMPLSAPTRRPMTYVEPQANRVLFLHVPGAQAQVGIFGPDGVLDTEMTPTARVYNEYMSGSMGSVVFQEVREARSLAYSVWTYYSAGRRLADANALQGAMSNQQDKAVEAIEVLMGLVRELPPSETRLNQVRGAIDESYRTNRLGFRRMAGAALSWDRWGVDGDPREWNWRTATGLTLPQLQAFAARFRELPFTITVAGDRDVIDLEALARFGSVEEVSVDQLFNW